EQYQLTLPFAFHCILLGLIAGLLGIGFSLLFKLSERYIEQKIKIWMLPLFGMLLTMLIVYLAQLSTPDGVSLEGTGFHLINYILENFATMSTGILLVILLGKILATSLSIGMLNSGGVMGPSLVSGAALGALYANLFPNLNHIPMIIVGMAAMHTATTKTPIASMLLTLEMVGFPNLIIPIILANAMAFIISMDFSLYRGQVQSKEIILRRRIQHTDILETAKVSDAMIKQFPYVTEDAPLQEISRLLREHKISALPVVDLPTMRIKGIVSRADLQRGFSSQKKYAKEIMEADVIVAYPEETLNVAFDRLNDYRIETMPVVFDDETKTVIGLITFREIEDCYEKRVLQLHEHRELSMEELDEL
ncbi:MAG: chloride channel protein, partial [Candidatus Heimdallarchaeaceae archaeon]